ncbi:FAD-binding oxidoreductase [Bradyrhizobium jicamae]|uniref:FAD-binding oxidoreductase n=1 Tax=Bradyrhizobium jicamae TaxID=280332 RepID=A0ABS5FI36_9BRAD|nr:FAD-binding oxidoreductase [Bradyrhizobium jicamae]MBR0796051.1 FAD-binding oxidoreductase [Bradyrhizobium jicamae]
MIDTFKTLLGDAGVLTEPDDVAPYATDWKHTVRGAPACVLRPRNTADVAAVMRIAHERRIVIVPQGGNTGLAAGAVPDASGSQVVLSLSRMKAIQNVDPVGMTIEAEAGCILKTAQDAAADVGRLLPISLAAEGSAQIGGVVSTNAGGINVLRYGMARQLVLGLEVVQADGTVINGLRSLRKDNAGYDWKQLFIGSEGTLGIVTAAVLRLMPRPKLVVTSLLAVADPAAALRLLKLMQDELGETINAFELISGLSVKLVEEQFGQRAPLAGNGWFVLIEASANLGGLREAFENVLSRALEQAIATDGVIAESQTQAAQLWAIRERITEAELKAGRSVKHDVSVPIPALPAFLADAEASVSSGFPGARINAFGHAGDGNMHFNVLVSVDTDSAALNRSVYDLVAIHGGSISAEHGIGSYRVAELAHYRAGAELSIARLLKRSLDPKGILNSGKILGMEK